MGIKRVIDVDFWTDEKVVELFSPEDRYFFLYLLTNPHTTQLGVYRVPLKIMAFETGYQADTVNVILDRFEKKYGLILRNPETGEIAIRNYLRHSVVKGGKPVLDLLEREASQVKDRNLLGYVCKAASGSTNDTVRTFASKYQNLYRYIDNIYNNNIHSINQNDNEDSWTNRGRIVDDSSKIPNSREKQPITRHKYGEYQNVLLTDEELQKVKNEFPTDWQTRIERLSEYIASKGAKYKNHLAVIRSWARKDKENESKTVGPDSGITIAGIGETF